MRTGGRRRGIAQTLSRFRRSFTVAALATAGVAVPLPSGGDHWMAGLSRHLVPLAEARKAPKRSSAVLRPGLALKLPAFPPLLRELPALRPPAAAFKAPAFAPLPKPRRTAALPPGILKGPAFKLPGERAGAQTSTNGTWTAAVERRDRPSWNPRTDLASSEPERRHPSLRKMLEKLSKPAARRKAPQAEAPPSKRDDGAETGPTGRTTTTGKTRRRLGSRPVGELLPPIGSFRPNEVLAINLGPEGLAKVRAGNYKLVGQIDLPELGLTVARLEPPTGLNTIAGWDALYDLAPEGGFALNRVYTPYRLGAGPGGSGPGVSAAAGKGCTAERCFGATLINWQTPLGACARDVKVGVVDTGFDTGHPAFAGLRYSYEEFLPEGRIRASEEHGTGVLSLLAGHAGSGTPGLIPEAHFILANAFYADSEGEPISDTVHMLQALAWLKKSGVAVANLSFAGPPDDLLHHAVRELTKAGIVVVAAVGNEGPSAPPGYPAAYEEVIAVTAVDRHLAAYRYASRGDHIDLAAPGVDVWTALPGRREGPQTGTSFAVPFVTAVLAAANGGVRPRPDGDPLAAKARALAAIAKGIKSLGRPDRDPTFGAGLVQAPAPCETIAPRIVAAAQPWTGTVRREIETVAAGPATVGAWVSTVHTTSDGVASR
jgi:hypothetical protein